MFKLIYFDEAPDNTAILQKKSGYLTNTMLSCWFQVTNMCHFKLVHIFSFKMCPQKNLWRPQWLFDDCIDQSSPLNNSGLICEINKYIVINVSTYLNSFASFFNIIYLFFRIRCPKDLVIWFL